MRPDNTPADGRPADRDLSGDDLATGLDTDLDADVDAELDADGAPCLICGQTVPGPRPDLLCPDCNAATGPGR
jgi:hypothetical protein